nr:hypothetical protein B0A51_04897 [Rachicladosporium sp. CCFEE 5018]
MAALGTTSTRYVYSPLLPRHTRLLKYTAAAPEAPQVLNLALVTCALHDFCRPYIALSYTWDAPITADDEAVDLESETREVLIESVAGAPSTIEIRRNLYDALQTLGPAMLQKTRDDGVSHIWIDAICINQEDLEERSQQVALMGKIYSTAVSVWAWLGAADDTTDSVSVFHTALWDAMDQTTRDHPWTEQNIRYRTGGVIFPKLCMAVSMSQVRDLYRFYARRRLLNRLWVVQELVLGNDVLLWIDTLPVSLTVFRFWASLVTEDLPFNYFKLHAADIAGELANVTQNLRALFVTTELATQHGAGGPLDPAHRSFLQQACGARFPGAETCAAYLVQLLAITCNHDAKDPRDKLCGILGMVQPFWPSDGTPLIEPSYATPVEQIYYELAIWCMHIQSNLCVLSLVVRTPEATASDMPSWVPNLAARTLDAPELLQHYLFEDGPTGASYVAFHANGPSRTREPCFRVNGMSLLARGHMLATIETLSVGSPVFSVLKAPPVETAGDTLCALQLLEYMISCCLAQSPYLNGRYVNGQHVIEAVVGCALMSYDGGNGPTTWFLSYATWLLGTRYKRADPENLALACRQRCMDMLEELPLVFSMERLTQIRDIDASDSLNAPEYSEVSTEEVVFHSMLDKPMASRRMFQTDTQLLGLAHVAAMAGDEVWILSDAKVPFVLRLLSDSTGRYSLVGEAYVHGVMFGQLVNEDDPDMLWETVEIV